MKKLLPLFTFLIMGMGTLWASGTKDDYLNSYLTVESLTDNDTITLRISKQLTAEQLNWVAYSTDGIEWTTIVIDTILQKDTIILNQGEKLHFKGFGKQCGVYINNVLGTFNIKGSNDHIVYGNVMSLLYGDDFASQTTLPEGSDYNFVYLFRENLHLVSAENLMLPATSLTNSCYYGLFLGCHSLVLPSELPAVNLSDNCYAFMFYGCSALTEAPALPANTLKNYCYFGMFTDCISLITSPKLPATTLADYCYGQMFYGCSSLTSSPPELPATTLANECYSYMFCNCTSLKRAPVLEAPVLTFNCYGRMFKGCSNLQEVTCLAIDISATDCVVGWMEGVAPSGIFYRDPEMEDWPLDSNSGIPIGWTVANYDGVEEQQDHVVAYPNPIVDKLHITGTDIQSVEVFDAQGRLVHTEECGHAEQVEVDFQGYAKGIYSVSINSARRKDSKKVIY